MSESYLNYIIQISLIFFSMICSISLFSDFGGKKHSTSIYPYISSVIILGFLPINNIYISPWELGLISIYSLLAIKLINFIFKDKLNPRWIITFSALIGLLIIYYFRTFNSLRILSSSYLFGFFVLLLLLAFIYYYKENNDSKLIKIISLLPLIISSVFLFLSDYSLIAYIMFILYALFDAKKIYMDVKNTKKEFEERLESLEKDFKNELEKSVRSRTFYLERLKDRMAEVNKIDHLTKALNRKAITSTIDDLINSSEVSHFVMLLFDIDNFKTINDSHGHITGDVCLKTLSAIALKNIRDVDFLGRYGGDEFIIVLPNQSLKEGIKVAERFRQKVSETQNPHFTISIGASAYPWDGESMNALLSVADKGLYLAKEKNRNNVSYDGYIKLENRL